MKAFANKLKRNKVNDRMNHNGEQAPQQELASPIISTMDQQLYQQSLAQALPGHYAQSSIKSQSAPPYASSIREEIR